VPAGELKGHVIRPQQICEPFGLAEWRASPSELTPSSESTLERRRFSVGRQPDLPSRCESRTGGSYPSLKPPVSLDASIKSPQSAPTKARGNSAPPRLRRGRPVRFAFVHSTSTPSNPFALGAGRPHSRLRACEQHFVLVSREIAIIEMRRSPRGCGNKALAAPRRTN